MVVSRCRGVVRRCEREPEKSRACVVRETCSPLLRGRLLARDSLMPSSYAIGLPASATVDDEELREWRIDLAAASLLTRRPFGRVGHAQRPSALSTLRRAPLRRSRRRRAARSVRGGGRVGPWRVDTSAAANTNLLTQRLRIGQRALLLTSRFALRIPLQANPLPAALHGILGPFAQAPRRDAA